MRIYIADRIWSGAEALFREYGYDVVYEMDGVSDIDFIIVRSSTQVDRALIDRLSNKGLSEVLRAGTGLDNIDVDYCRSKDIEVTNFPSMNSSSVAEVTLAFMLMAAHRLYSGNYSMRQGRFEKEQLIGANLSSRTIGLIGYGSTAKATIELLKRVGVSRFLVARKTNQPIADECVELVDVDQCFSADILSLHIPLTESTRGIVNAERLEKTKSSFALINMGRRGCTDLQAVEQSLQSGKLAFYASDVLCPNRDASLLSHSAVMGTPHLGAQSVDCMEAIADQLLQHIRSKEAVT